jgi:hypothetical protein
MGESTAGGFGLSGEEDGDLPSSQSFLRSWPQLVGDSLNVPVKHVSYAGAYAMSWVDVLRAIDAETEAAGGFNTLDPTVRGGTPGDSNFDWDVYATLYTQVWRLLKELNAVMSSDASVTGTILMMIGGNDAMFPLVWASVNAPDSTMITGYSTADCLSKMNTAEFAGTTPYIPNFSMSYQAGLLWCLKRLRSQLPKVKIVMVQPSALSSIFYTDASVRTRYNRIVAAQEAYANAIEGVYYVPFKDAELGPETLYTKYIDNTGTLFHPNQLWNNAMATWVESELAAL